MSRDKEDKEATAILIHRTQTQLKSIAIDNKNDGSECLDLVSLTSWDSDVSSSKPPTYHLHHREVGWCKAEE